MCLILVNNYYLENTLDYIGLPVGRLEQDPGTRAIENIFV